MKMSLLPVSPCSGKNYNNVSLNRFRQVALFLWNQRGNLILVSFSLSHLSWLYLGKLAFWVCADVLPEPSRGSAGVLTCLQHPGAGLASEIHRWVIRRDAARRYEPEKAKCPFYQAAGHVFTVLSPCQLRVQDMQTIQVAKWVLDMKAAPVKLKSKRRPLLSSTLLFLS